MEILSESCTNNLRSKGSSPKGKKLVGSIDRNADSDLFKPDLMFFYCYWHYRRVSLNQT